MKIGVLVKQVPDTETKIKLLPDGSGIETTGIKYIMNPYDEYAVEEALKTKEKAGGEVVVVSLGPPRVVEGIRTSLAMGADRGIHIDDTGLTLDPFVVAKILAAVLKTEGFDVVFCGKKAIDDDAMQVAQMVAEFLEWPHVMVIGGFELKGDQKGARVQRRIGGGAIEVIDVAFPVVLGCDKGLNTPRYASLPGIMKAKSKPLAVVKGLDLAGGALPKIDINRWHLPPERQAGKVVGGDSPEAKARELVRLLREEAKVI